MGKILITGGAGYIGSHVTLALLEKGFQALVLDNLSTGTTSALIPPAAFVQGDLRDLHFVSSVFQKHSISAVMHFAASISVPESVSDPQAYYENNCSTTCNLLKAMRASGVKRMIFSSSAAVYGMSGQAFVTEDSPVNPINPYGRTKLIGEWMIKDAAAAESGFTYAILRYFNVAGTDIHGRLGQNSPQATHLIKSASLAALGASDHFTIFGTDYPTPDGTCIRDFIHVSDLSDIHVRALEHLLAGGDSAVLNCGYGRGYSVRKVISAMRSVSGVDFPIIEGPRRPGDPPAIVADTSRMRGVLDWVPKHDDLETIIKTALAWEMRLKAQAA